MRIGSKPSRLTVSERVGRAGLNSAAGIISGPRPGAQVQRLQLLYTREDTIQGLSNLGSCVSTGV